MTTGPRFLTIKDVMEELQVSDAQVRALIRAGDLRAFQVGGRGQWRIGRVDLEDYIAAAYGAAESSRQSMAVTGESEAR